MVEVNVVCSSKDVSEELPGIITVELMAIVYMKSLLTTRRNQRKGKVRTRGSNIIKAIR